MTTYTAPTRDMEFVINELAGLQQVAGLPGCEEASSDLVSSVLEEAGKLGSEVLAPLNHAGDQQRARMEDGEVRTPDGWKEAYRTFIDSGWNGLPFSPDHGGQGLPWLLATAVQEIWHASNMAFGLCPLLTQAAIEAIDRHASKELQELYLEKLVSGEWTGTMTLTEPQAGSDLSAVRTRAVPEGDHYLITGQKIFITYGEHDLTENIIHLVLARTPDAPEGVKGISLFVVPKFKVGANGELLERNDVRCVSLEHKLGIHASPTAVLAYGDKGGAVGFPVGEENRGLEYMFTMMNLARHAVGVEGVGIAERAYQQAREYAKERKQGHAIGADGNGRSPIIDHPDVRRMLMTMKAHIEAMRALVYVAASGMDHSFRNPDTNEKARHASTVDVLIPVVKGWSSELGVEIASLGVQIHGGMGYIEETGAAQHLRDARITPIYEGTTGIQAADLVGRKLIRDHGESVHAVLADMRADAKAAENVSGDEVSTIRQAFEQAIDTLAQATDWILQANEQDPRLPAAASAHYLRLFGTVAGGWQMTRAAHVAQRKIDAGDNESAFYRTKLNTALFYAQQVLPQASAFLQSMTRGSEVVMALTTDEF
ncbi:MAG: acyl-CoA dehydrogenase [Gammaproteobacteria bacterium]